MKRTGTTIALTIAMTMGCTPEPVDGFGGRSSVMALSGDGDSVFVADADNGTLMRVDLSNQSIESVVLGNDPKRVARIGKLIYVTLAGERAIAVVADEASGMRLVDTHRVGAEPWGIVAAPDGSAVYVALSTEDAVVELSADSLEEQRRFEIPGQPRWLAIHANGRKLFAASAYQGGLHRIDLASGDVRALELPRMERGVFDRQTGRDELVDMVPRLTGDPAISPDGGLLAVPVLYVDNATSVGSEDPTSDDPGDHDDFGDEFPEGGGGGYASGNVEGGITRFNPAVVTISLDPSGEPRTVTARASLVSGRAALSEDDVFPEDDFGERFDTGGFGAFGQGTRVRGYLSSLAFDASGHSVLATIENSSSVAVLAARPVQSGRPNTFDDDDPFFGDGAFESSPLVLIGTGAGPQGIVHTADGAAMAYNFLDRSLSEVDTARAEQQLEKIALGERFGNDSWFAGAAMQLEPSILPPDVLAGRRLFFSGTASSMAQAGAGVSCATCHFDGRNDGLTWQFDHGARNTPSLAGEVSLTAPVTWTSSVESVAREAFITSQGRMGGDGITSLETADIAAYIDATRDADVPERGSDDARIEEGRKIFQRADVACATCHTGPRLSDNKSYTMFGIEGVNTPGLVGLVASAPYLHDGSAKTLRDVLLRADEEGMGRTKHLTPPELDALELYLRSL